ncbi:MAG TPA: hypothetical protein VL098_00010 [Flavipsychrobacter sp.]|nr:hypothetical protein [Flavipsychrobacter sp.]
MKTDNNSGSQQSKNTDPQEDEKNGNIFGEAFDKIFGDVNGEHSVADKDAEDPGKQESIKE